MKPFLKFWNYLKTDDKKTAGTEKILHEPLKSSVAALSELLADNSISKGVFPDIAKVATVDKQSNDKSKVSNFTPVAVLNISFKRWICYKNSAYVSFEWYLFTLYCSLPWVLWRTACVHQITWKMEKKAW